MSNMITFELDHSFAGDLASLGVEYVPNETDDYLIDVTVNKWECNNELFGYLDDNCTGWY